MPADAQGGTEALETTTDAFLGGQLVIEQTQGGSRAGLDAVFLAVACPVKAGQTVLELGSGSGIVALAIARRVADTQVTGIEIDPALRNLAIRNAERNGLAERAAFFCGDVTGALAAIFDAGLLPDSFDHVVANPPFLNAKDTRAPSDEKLRRAHSLEAGDLEKWIRTLAAFVRPGGSATLIHRADALPELLKFCAGRFGELIAYPLFPRIGEPASRIIIQGRKGSRGPFRLARGMVLHEAGREFTPEAKAVLRDGRGLDVTPSN